mmetsp:Transcript_75681/g.67890  ORF Transcript_75681/g.67890 Transcript_75681/m.67890 type:complete len:565 (+) Transcript_75681:76-1770(+)|eukprot:CAMPEP_0201586004 /NCGR_PEP_ID=MMETSP0190_2-20130828/127805_1 /ASSEMBLY_ACC=CAM_ASM_000263 /TAXON_ID=37353 /ORGANISM="Rosalina sp." /LENGTH=564 /DNA_ID=CAMNT_0048033029 /DNA_START=76 /DNA_END=1770 /DNA_ORIENTATION=+
MQRNNNGRYDFVTSAKNLDFSDFSDKEIRWLANLDLISDAPTERVNAMAGQLQPYLKALIELNHRERSKISSGVSSFATSDYSWDGATGIMDIADAQVSYRAGCLKGDDAETDTVLKYSVMVAAPVKVKSGELSVSNVTPHKAVESFVPGEHRVNLAFCKEFAKAAMENGVDDVVHLATTMGKKLSLEAAIGMTEATVDPVSVCTKNPIRFSTGVKNVITDVNVPTLSSTPSIDHLIQYIAYLYQGVPQDTLGYFNSCHYDGMPSRGKDRVNHDCLRDVILCDAHIYITDRRDAHFLCGLYTMLRKFLSHKFVIVVRGKFSDGSLDKFLDIEDDTVLGIIASGQVTIAYERKLNWGKLRIHYMYFAIPNFFYKKQKGWRSQNVINDDAFKRDHELKGKSYQRYVIAPAVTSGRRYSVSAFLRKGVVREFVGFSRKREEEEEEEEGLSECSDVHLMSDHAVLQDTVRGLMHYATYHYHQTPFVKTPVVFEFSPKKEVIAITTTVAYKISCMSQEAFDEFLKEEELAINATGKSTLKHEVPHYTVEPVKTGSDIVVGDISSLIGKK